MDKSNKTRVVIFDLDGTLADVSRRRKILQQTPKAWDAFFADMDSDPPNPPIVELYKVLEASRLYSMYVVTGRPERYREVSARWISFQGLKAERLFMRIDGDKREDHIIKMEILNEIRASGEEIAFVVDDRESVVKMWRENGVTCLQCDYWND
ncbi:MAG: hypothetical protein M0023_01740 [Desulfobacteraceae bacterium]|nr:hypothetical protein [Desulfobacteraceae bacterium]